ncbi:ARS binding protein 2 [Botrytis cinerea]
MTPEATKRSKYATIAPQGGEQYIQAHNQAACANVQDRVMPERPVQPLPMGNSSPSHQNSRSLPSREVTDENFDDAYVGFIMYCNPAVASDTDTAELKRIFRAPPRSDNKSFSTFVLFELICKLENKEIKTWAQLAIDLGVEPPSLEKGQSAQKVQQYAVRLKRWLHAMHVDAFFEYLLNKPHVYWTQVPSPGEPPSELGRDGVTADEDLALRALLPETRPKRGRKKAEDREDDEIKRSPSQRPRLHSPTLSEDYMIARTSLHPDSATPATAHSSFQQGFDARLSPWSAATEVRGSLVDNFRWGAPPESATPLSAYPQSALTPSNRTHLWPDSNEPQSATTPNRSRSRRRHGPAVSSAWPSNGSASTGKLRGRPPNNRSVTDGPFSTFPANPGSIRDTPTATPIVADSEIPHFFPTGVRANPPTAVPQTQNSRPNRLSLQVPQRKGGNVRLATPPPPVVLLNGETGTNMQNDLIEQSQQTSFMEYFNNHTNGPQDPSFEHFVSIAFRQNEDFDRTNIDALESHFIGEILVAEWYDVAGNSIPRCSIDEASKICKQVIRNLQAESSSTEAFLINLSALAGGPLMTRLRVTRLEFPGPPPRTDYEYGNGEGMGDMGRGRDDEEESWKAKYLSLQQQIKERDAKVMRLKRGMVDALVTSEEWIKGGKVFQNQG